MKLINEGSESMMRIISLVIILTFASINAAEARPSAWCGWWMGKHTGKTDRRLWAASEWSKEGHHVSGPMPGAIGVLRHHVFQVIKVLGPGKVLAISGNDGHAVRTRPRSTRGVFAWRML